jgi:hypothetical protein
MRIFHAVAFAALLVLNLSGCQATMYRALESVGVEKREILVKRVSAARDAQSEAKDQFVSALDQFRALVDVQGGELERTYDRMNSEYERSQARAKEVSERVDAVEAVAEDLFDEWKDELEQYSDPALRRDSQRLLSDTRRRYTGLIASMRRAEASMHPVLNVFRDRVLVLKHNLNAKAVGSLRKELGGIERQTSKLVADMERAISQADAFINSMKG